MDNNQSTYDRQRWCCEQCFRKCNGRLHTIKAGETLYSIGRMYNVPVAAITRANPYLNVYNLRINDQICIPDGSMPRPMPRNASQEQTMAGNMMAFREIPDDLYEMNGMGNNSFNENDSIKDFLNKTGMSMEELIHCINKR